MQIAVHEIVPVQLPQPFGQLTRIVEPRSLLLETLLLLQARQGITAHVGVHQQYAVTLGQQTLGGVEVGVADLPRRQVIVHMIALDVFENVAASRLAIPGDEGVLSHGPGVDSLFDIVLQVHGAHHHVDHAVDGLVAHVETGRHLVDELVLLVGDDAVLGDGDHEIQHLLERRLDLVGEVGPFRQLPDSRTSHPL